MKNVLSKLFLLIMSICMVSLVGCSSNTQNENTGIGAVTGGVAGGLAGSLIGGGTGKVVAVGVGAVAGALLGGYIGHNMDNSDQSKTYEAMDNNQPNEPTYWKNKKTGATYKVVPISGRMTVNGNPHCRKYRSTVMIGGKKQHVYGVACRRPDGTWVAVNP